MASIAIWAATLLLSYELAYAHTITRLITNDPRWQIESSFPVRNTVVAVVPLVFVYALGRRFERVRSAAQLALCVSMLFLPFNSFDFDCWLSTREVVATHYGCVSYPFDVEFLLPAALIDAFVAMRAPLHFNDYHSLVLISAALSAVGLAGLWRHAKARDTVTIIGSLACLACAVFALENSITRPQPGAWIGELPSVAHVDVASISAASRTPTRVGVYHATRSSVGAASVEVEFQSLETLGWRDRADVGRISCQMSGAMEVRRLSQKHYAARCIDSDGAHAWTGVGIGRGWGEVWRAHAARRIAPPIEWSIFAFAGITLGALFAFGLRRSKREAQRVRPQQALAPYRSNEHPKRDPLRLAADTRALDQLAILTMILHACWPVVLWALVQRFFLQR